ncbi:MAG: Asp-tRNA(Asn)/Glu-tRNA(Gln) amidotransferase subunit GatA [Thermotogae bacterium]|nr:Asp-tRNA(Asn)/Glu-tRNA(Gln) amidotransferase subunit GatA [Thermotogota bacterium]
MNPVGLTLEAILKEIESGRLNRDELFPAFHERIKMVDSKVKAFISVLDEPIEGTEDGDFYGIPYALKDNIMAIGTKTTCASRILENYDSPYDATVTEKLKKHGFFLVGKTNLDEFAMGSSTENSAFFPSRNPWDTERIPGGSSGGSAVAVASGEVPFALGSDTGGSIRQPSAYCGVVGFKPTYGLVSRYGLVAFASSLDQIGPITLSVRDSALVMNMIHGKDPRDMTTVDRKIDFMREIEEGIDGMKFVIPEEFISEGLQDEVRDVIDRTVRKIESLGAKVVRKSLPSLKYVVAVYYIIAPAEASSNLARYDGVKYGLRVEMDDLKSMYMRTRDEGFGMEVKRRIMLGTFTLSAAYYEAYFGKAQKVRTMIKNEVNEILKEYDAIIGPTTPTLPPKIGEITDPLTYYLMDIYTIPANLVGAPAISIPVDFVKGLPVGFQVMGKRYDDPKILRIARSIERNVGILDGNRYNLPKL